MLSLTNAIRETARELLTTGKVDVVIGYERGSVPLRATPVFIRDAAQVERLIWDETCENVLANFLKDTKGKKAVVAKGCDSRAIALLINEGQLNRDDLYIIGISCAGVVDRRKIETELGGEILAADLGGGKVYAAGVESEKTYDFTDVKDKTCRQCRYPNPVLCDVHLGEAIERPLGSLAEEYADVIAAENLSPQEREAICQAEMAKCTRCYSCRNACSLCYCPECFVDANAPRWVSGGTSVAENLFFHTGRLMHLAGRCVACGACARACPQGVDIQILKRKITKDVLELYNHEAGLCETCQPALNEYTTDDQQPFLVKE